MATAISDARAPEDAGSATASQESTRLSVTHDETRYTVRLPGFEGPLDLLLHLIEKNQLEITTISLVAVTDQFIQYIHGWEHPPMPRLAEFVAMAARLLLIKSRSLLPRQLRQEDLSDETDPLEDAEMLRRHLIEYKMAREIARALKAREIAGLQTFSRPGPVADAEAMIVWAPPRLIGLNVNALALVFRRVLAEKRLSEPERLPLPVITITEKIAEVEALLVARERATLEEVLRTATSRFAVVVTFLAVLEMWHQARVEVLQDGLFAPIEIRRGPKFGQHIEASSFDVASPDATPAVIPSASAPAPSTPSAADATTDTAAKPPRAHTKRARAAQLALHSPGAGSEQ
ncbi:MAG TPA: segregation/condensation protein A [Ktedonobacterales bacterium]|nr:segregation/condensation protein A [Ktedonobacterales bacterium]